LPERASLGPFTAQLCKEKRAEPALGSAQNGSMMPEQRKQDDDGDRDTDQPEQHATTEAHVYLLSSVSDVCRTRVNEIRSTAGTSVDAKRLLHANCGG
jgi:hypothetical protein